MTMHLHISYIFRTLFSNTDVVRVSMRLMFVHMYFAVVFTALTLLLGIRNGI